MDKSKLLNQIDDLIKQGEKFLGDYPKTIVYFKDDKKVDEFRNLFKQWQHNSRFTTKLCLSYLKDDHYEQNPLYKDVNNASTFLAGFSSGNMLVTRQCNVSSPVNKVLNSLKSLKTQLELYENKIEINMNNKSISILHQICDNFSNVVRELIDYSRYDKKNRTTITMLDEYDAQYLFGALLHLFFDEIIPEEYSPEYAGGKSRIDFHLPKEKIIIELKFTSKSVKDKEIGEQLAIDYTRYQGKKDWDKLFCFIYDPKNLIRRGNTLKRQLEETHDQMIVVISN